MKPIHRALMREQLDLTLDKVKPLKTVAAPPKGWIRAIRDALGINTRQLAERLGVNRSRIGRIERDEVGGSLTIKTLQRVAEAMDCTFVYGFVPRTSLQDTVERRARQVAASRMLRVAHTMVLEDQGLSDREQRKAIEAAANELITAMPKELWDKRDD